MTALILLSLVLGQINVDFTSTSVPFSNAPYDVQYTLANAGVDVTRVLWDFGDGRTSTETNPRYTYLNSGTFDVKLTVFYNENNAETSKSILKPKHVVTYFTSKAPWAAREGHASVVFDDKLWVMGGHSSDPDRENVRFNDVWYTEEGTTWTMVTEAALWPPRSSFTVTSYEGFMWLIGGITGEGTASGEVWSSSEGSTWNLFNSEAITPRYSHNAAVFLDKIYLLGGRNFENGGLSDLITFDGVNFSEVLSQGLWGVICGHAMEVIPVNGVDTLIVFGGSNGDSLNRSVFLTTDGENWKITSFGKITEGYIEAGKSIDPKKV
jgi:PKD repeat protein